MSEKSVGPPLERTLNDLVALATLSQSECFAVPPAGRPVCAGRQIKSPSCNIKWILKPV